MSQNIGVLIQPFSIAIHVKRNNCEYTRPIYITISLGIFYLSKNTIRGFYYNYMQEKCDTNSLIYKVQTDDFCQVFFVMWISGLSLADILRSFSR